MRSPLVWLLGVGVLGLLTVYPAVVTRAAVDLSPRRTAEDFSQVAVELEVGGHLKVRDAGTDAGEEKRLPLSVRATLDYQEWQVPADLASHWVGDADGARLGMRYYDRAEAVIKVDDGGNDPRLPDDRRLVLVRTGEPAAAGFWCPAGHLDRDERDLIDVVGNSLALNALLPDEPVAETDAWQQDDDTMGSLLGLDSVAVCEVQCVIEKSNARYAQIRLAGVVHGSVDGAATEIDLQGVYLFDRQQRRITKLNLAVKEKRTIGDVTPGLDVVAKLKMKIQPLGSTSKLGPTALDALKASGGSFDTSLSYAGRPQGFRFVYEPRWFVTSEDRESVTLRRINDGDLVAHCTISRLPEKSAGRQTTLEEFQKDIKFSLRDNFGQFVRAEEWTSSQGHHCCGVVASGAVDGVAVEWHYYLVAPEEGHRASLAFTMTEPMAERLGEADRALVDALEFAEPVPLDAATVAENTNQADDPPDKPHTANRHRRRRRMSRGPGGFRIR